MAPKRPPLVTAVPRERLAIALLVGALSVGGALCWSWPASAKDNQAVDLPPGAYPLDQESRHLPRGSALPCDRYPLVTYRGISIPYDTSVRVFPAFADRLQRLEALIVELSLKYYGRTPRRLVHLGTHNCRRIRAYPDWISEHTFGNAIDLAGLDFGPLPRGPRSPQSLSDMPRGLRRAFKVRLLDHWKGRNSAGKYHSRFLRELATRLIEERTFRGILGPAWPGHRNHFHLDMAPYRIVEVFEQPPGATR